MRSHNLLSMSEDQVFDLIKSPDNIAATKTLQILFDTDEIYGKQVTDLLDAGLPETRAFVTFLARQIAPSTYLEIGVRRGWSTAAVASASPDCDIYAFDGWHANYAGVPNPGPSFVQDEMKKFGYTKPINFINGDSHQTIPQFFSDNPDKMFDMILVDGDHSDEGAWLDLKDTMPHIAIGGIMIFDDILDYEGLRKLWQGLHEKFPNFKYFSYLGNRPGVGFAVRTS